jgi:hypothetical protein
MAYPDPKGERDNSLPAKRRSGPGVGLRRRETRVIWRRLDCLKPNLQQTQRNVRRNGTCYRRCALRWHHAGAVATFGAQSVAQRGQSKEMSGTPKSRSDVRQGRTRDQPTGREPQGDGVPIVVVRFTPHQGGRESRPQGEGAQATEYRRPGGMRNAERRNGTRCPAASNRGMVAGEPGELKGSRRVREGGVGKGPQGTSPAPYLN